MKKPVIYFDGICGLCNGFIDFVISVDKKNFFQFSPLQSEHAKMNLPPHLTVDLKTIVLQINERTYIKSAAVLMVLSHLGGVWKIMSVAKFLPQSFSNFIYDLIAANRYHLFGKKETCRLPTPEERARFIL